MSVTQDQRLGDDEHGAEADGAYILTQIRVDGTYKSEFDNALDLRLKALGLTNYTLESLGYVYDEAGNRTDTREFDFRVTFYDEAQIAAVTAIMESHAALVPATSKATFNADNADSTTITLAGQTSFAYKVWFEHQIRSQASINDGSIQLLTDTPGKYVVELGLAGNTGFVSLEAL